MNRLLKVVEGEREDKYMAVMANMYLLGICYGVAAPQRGTQISVVVVPGFGMGYT